MLEMVKEKELGGFFPLPKLKKDLLRQMKYDPAHETLYTFSAHQNLSFMKEETVLFLAVSPEPRTVRGTKYVLKKNHH